MRRSACIAGALALLVFACSTPKVRTGSLASAFEVLETRHGSGRTTSPGTRLVDYESGITIRPDLAKLTELLGVQERAASASDAQEIEARIADARENRGNLKALGRIVDVIAEYEVLASAFTASFSEGTLLGTDPAYLELLAKRGEVIVDIDRLAQLYVEVVELGHEVDWTPLDITALSPAQEAALGNANLLYKRVHDPMSPGAEGRDPRYEADEVARVLTQTTAHLGAQLKKLEKAFLDAAPKAKLEMEATLVRAGKAYPISITPYTTVEGVDRGSKSPRIGVPSEADLQSVEAGYKAYGELAESLNHLKELSKDDEAVRELSEALKTQLQTVARRLTDGLLKTLKSLADWSEPEFKALKEAASSLQASLAEIEDHVRFLGGTSDPVLLVSRSSTLISTLRAADLPAKCQALKDAIDNLDATFVAGLVEARSTLLETLGTLALEELTGLEEALSGKPGGKDLAQLFRSVKELHALSRPGAWGGLELGNIERNALDLALAQDGFVDLASSPAESGDLLEVDIQVTVNPDADKGEQLEHRVSAWLDIRKFGPYSTLKPQLIFYDRLHDGSSAYKATPGLGYNLHYRADSWYAFWDAFDPAIGFSVSAPSFDTGVDLAVGLQLTFFNDMLQTGYAYNLNVEQNRDMFYFGFDLIGAFQKAL